MALLTTALGASLFANYSSAAAQSPQPQQKLVLAHYMPWYAVSPEWGLHWTGPQRQHDPRNLDDAGLPDIWSHFHPLIGLYDSADPHVIECQLLQMKLAGIDGVIVDWYGISDAADYRQIHIASQKVFECAKNLDMQFAVCFEDRTIERLIKSGQLSDISVPEHLAEILRWAHDNWFSAPNYVRVDGRPLLLNFGPVFLRNGAIWKSALSSLPQRPKFFALDHLWKEVGADGGFAWVYADACRFNSGTNEVESALAAEYASISSDSSEIIASALPGFDDVYAKSYPTVPHRNGATLRESLSFALNGPWSIVQLVTWNDYGEGTMIEPTHEFGYLFLEIIQEARRQEVGSQLAYGVQDLRLPAGLYELRRSGAVDQVKLDEIADLLSLGKAALAREAIDRMANARVMDAESRKTVRSNSSQSKVSLTSSLPIRGEKEAIGAE